MAENPPDSRGNRQVVHIVRKPTKPGDDGQIALTTQPPQPLLDLTQGVSCAGELPLSPTLREFLRSWQPRQRISLGMLAALITRLQAVINVHADWAEYDLWTHLLAALHLIIENDRLTGGHTEEQIIDELVTLVAAEAPADDPAKHRAIAEAVVDVLTNARDRRLRLKDTYLDGADGSVQRRVQSFAFVRTVGDEESSESTLRATPQAVNVFQNLYEFDPSDRAAAERYRSQRMLDRQEYDEVLTSVHRRSTAAHGLRRELEGLMRRINYNVRTVDYSKDVIPRLDEVIQIVKEQVNAEERFAETVAEIAHHAAPDMQRLQRINANLRGLIESLGSLQSIALSTRRVFEVAQDRQLFKYRRITIDPKSQLLEPLLGISPSVALEMLAAPLVALLGPRPPMVTHFGEIVERSTPGERSGGSIQPVDPFELGDSRADKSAYVRAIFDAVGGLLATVEKPTPLSLLLSTLEVNNNHEIAAELPWALAITVANAYGHRSEQDSPAHFHSGFDHSRLAVVALGDEMPERGRVGGSELIIVPYRTRKTDE